MIIKNARDIRNPLNKSFRLDSSVNANNNIIPEDKKNENLNCVALKHKKLIIQKIMINFLLFFSNGKTKKVIRNAIKFVPIANSCGLAVNVKNRKLGIHKIAKHIKILLFKFE
tara:strand:- start:24 stop:362 length:339 start_codon:yes stop_codon:yes gene_type:complete